MITIAAIILAKCLRQFEIRFEEFGENYGRDWKESNSLSVTCYETFVCLVWRLNFIISYKITRPIMAEGG